ncbi:hypothetical protein GT347_04545 [Xylophilus rhododendri]|uniref:DUF2135 domain-containing protein n=2 Tax=Xylophilus rhododendri TaxID=2697032 RepID=A0A857JDZ0_9BURK|nr:hypothetical protein GT347_04545 [Xylophilus rhododendri]
MDSLQTPETVGSPGAFTVTLTWDGPGDVDLHTFEPTGTHVYYDHPVGHAGFLDVDNTVGYGPEHYYAACDSRTLQTGAYAIVIDNFDKTPGRQATVQVASSREGVIFTAKLPVGTASTPVVSVLVSQDQKGRFRFAAQ